MSLNRTLLKVKPHKPLVLDMYYYLIFSGAFLTVLSLEFPSPLILKIRFDSAFQMYASGCTSL